MPATIFGKYIAVTSGFEAKRLILTHPGPGLHQPSRLKPLEPRTVYTGLSCGMASEVSRHMVHGVSSVASRFTATYYHARGKGWCRPGWDKMLRFSLKPLVTAIYHPNLATRVHFPSLSKLFSCSRRSHQHTWSPSRKLILSQGGHHQVRLGRIRHRRGHWETTGATNLRYHFLAIAKASRVAV